MRPHKGFSDEPETLNLDSVGRSNALWGRFRLQLRTVATRTFVRGYLTLVRATLSVQSLGRSAPLNVSKATGKDFIMTHASLGISGHD